MKTTNAFMLIVALVGCTDRPNAELDLPAAEGEARMENGVHSFVPAEGFVPTAEVAIGIGEAVLAPVYGAEVIRSQRPFRAELKGDIWTVEGTLPEGYAGGVAIVEISRSDGTILRMSHGL